MDELAQINALVSYNAVNIKNQASFGQSLFIFLILVVLAAVILLMMFRKFKKHQERSLGLM